MDDNSSFQVKQIVSGTGGAELDTPTKPGTISMQVDNMKLELVSYFAVRSYGYVIVEDADNNGQLNINFNPVVVIYLKKCILYYIILLFINNFHIVYFYFK